MIAKVVNAVLTTKVDPSYDDLPDTRYHFPKQYLGRIERIVGDLIVYYEPGRKGASDSDRSGAKSYFAVGRVSKIEQSPKRDGTFYAMIEDYLDFERRVPFREGEYFYESALRKPDGSHNTGAFINAVRLVPSDEFQNILRAGFAQPLDYRQDSLRRPFGGVAETPIAETDDDRPILQRIERRKFRDRVFSRRVREVYRERCSLTGLRLINGGGRPEVEAAHIRPVGGGHNGPDSIWNGIALCQTAHWMFDRGLVTLEDDYSIVVSPKAPDDAYRLLRRELVAEVPASFRERPHPSFLQYHRDNIFKQ
ncbi:MAG: HNH endonuclease [Rhodospirillaceae bacterium]|nr:HNH endonuclease [Rhodospirillaceae bacterium]